MGEYDREIHHSAALIGACGAYRARTRYRCVTPGIRVPRDDSAPSNVGDLATAILALYPDSVLAGWTAARLHGHSMARSRTRVEVICPRQIRRAGIVSRTARLEPHEIVTRFGVRCTSPVRTAIDLARYVPGDEAIAAMDQCLTTPRGRRPITTPAEIEAELDRREWWRGERVRTVLAESDPGAQSPPETFTRLLLHRGGLTMFRTQVPEPPYFVDLGEPNTKVGVEYDGEYHRSAEQQGADIRRRSYLRREGWDVILVSTEQLKRERRQILETVITALRDRGVDPRPGQ
jgi:very-short-patch-repair endonuclease